MQKIRGAEIALIFQEPMTALNPVFTIGSQIEETLLRPRPGDAAIRRAPGRSSCSTPSAFRSRGSASATIRTSCRAACGSAR